MLLIVLAAHLIWKPWHGTWDLTERLGRAPLEAVPLNGTAVSHPTQSAGPGVAWTSSEGGVQATLCAAGFLVIKISNFTVTTVAPKRPGSDGKDCLKSTQPQAPLQGSSALRTNPGGSE